MRCCILREQQMRGRSVHPRMPSQMRVVLAEGLSRRLSAERETTKHRSAKGMRVCTALPAAHLLRAKTSLISERRARSRMSGVECSETR